MGFISTLNITAYFGFIQQISGTMGTVFDCVSVSVIWAVAIQVIQGTAIICGGGETTNNSESLNLIFIFVIMISET